MKTYLRVKYLAVFIFLIIIVSCHKVYIYEGKAIIISRSTDLGLKDSALISGIVFSADEAKAPEFDAVIWVDGTDINTTVDSLVSFSFKLMPGKYTIRCRRKYSTDDMVELKNISILPNERIKIEFFLRIEVT